MGMKTMVGGWPPYGPPAPQGDDLFPPLELAPGVSVIATAENCQQRLVQPIEARRG